MSTQAPPTRTRTARWLCLAAVAAVLAAGCGTAVGYANTFLKLEEAGISGADLSTSDDQVQLAYDSKEAPGDALTEEENRAAEVIWRNLPQRFSALEVDPRVEDVEPQVYSREDLQSRFGPRPARLDQGAGDIEQDARDTFRAIIVGAAIGFAVLLALVILVIVLVVRAARKRRPPAPTAGWPGTPGGPPAPWPQQPGYGPPPEAHWGAQGQQAPVGAPPAQQWPGRGEQPTQQWPGQGPPTAQQWAGQGQPPPWQPGAEQGQAPAPQPPPWQQPGTGQAPAGPPAWQPGAGGWQPAPAPPPEGADAEADTQVIGGEDRPRRPEERRDGPTPPS
jgi:hypothetical protein